MVREKTDHREMQMGRKINTDYWAKPIPLRDFDWTATFDDYDYAPDETYHHPIGYGRTEQDAINDLLSQVEDLEQ